MTATGHPPESVRAAVRQLIGIVGIVVIQEYEERPLWLTATRQPVEEFVMDGSCLFSSIGVEPSPQWPYLE